MTVPAIRVRRSCQYTKSILTEKYTMRVDVYRSEENDALSVKSRESGKRYGTVVSHEQKIHIRDVEFVVQPAGREKVRESGVRRIHAFVRGHWDEREKVICGQPVTYDPCKHEQFVHAESEKPVVSAERVAVTMNDIRANGLQYYQERE